MNAADRLAKIERKMNDAARELQPLLVRGSRDLLSRELDETVVARRAHDALNALASAMLEVGLLQMETEDTTSKGAAS